VLGFTTGSREEVPGKRKPVIRDQQQQQQQQQHGTTTYHSDNIQVYNNNDVHNKNRWNIKLVSVSSNRPVTKTYEVDFVANY
jgi:hypothetical protein